MRHSFSLVALAAFALQPVVAKAKCGATFVERDVVVVGGGAAGSHAAVWLRDHGKSVLLVEKADQLGGHTNWYKDDVSGRTINVGVQAWMAYKDSFDFPARMNVSTSGSMYFADVNNKYIDFQTGLPVPDWADPGPDTLYPALQRYLDVLLKYEDLMLPGFFNFPKGKNVPEDLTMPFRDLVKKYDFAAAVPLIWDSTAQGLGDTMDVPSLFVFQASPVPMIQALLGQAAAAVPASGRLWDLYEKVAEFLGDDVKYSSTIVSSKRNAQGVEVNVQGADGTLTCVKAKRLLIAAQPTLETMKPFDLKPAEKDVFNKFSFATVYAGVVQHPSLQVPDSYSNRSPNPAALEYLVWPEPSQVGRIDWLGETEDLFQFTAVGTEDEGAEDMKKLIGETIDTLVDAGTLEPVAGAKPTFPIFADHGKMHPRVSGKELKHDFIRKMIDLQGKDSTWYTGAAFSAGFSTVIWEYNKVLLPKVIEGI